MTELDEEARAALWRQQTLNRIQFQTELWLAMAAPPEPRQQVMDDWQAFFDWWLERQAGATDPEDDP